MSVYDMPQNYDEANEMLKGESERKIAHETILIDNEDGTIDLKHWATIIATFNAERRIITIDTHGHHTTRTKQRINSILGSRYTLFQKNYKWFVWDRQENTTLPYSDGDEYFAKEG